MKTLVLACSLSFLTLGVVAQNDSAEPDNYLVVIGAFSSQENADRFVRKSQKYKVKPTSELNRIRGLYYVYVMQTADKPAAIAEAERIRKATPLADTWVYNGSLAEVVTVTKPVEKPVEPPVQEIAIVATDPPPAPVVVIPVKTEEEKIKEAVAIKPKTMKKGEMETLNFIYFFNDAAVLRPESKYEVDHLVATLQENPGEKIKIHGHTNGNARGKIIRMKENSKDFFSLDNTIEDYGSAVELSELRAKAIRDYLVANGIASNRMSIKAWGGKHPLFKEDDPKATANVRVEIEVMSKD